MQIKGNNLSFKTYSSAKVNHSELELNDFNPIEKSSSEQLDTEKLFENSEYGYSAETNKLNLNSYTKYDKIITNDKVKDVSIDETPSSSTPLIDTKDILLEEGEELKVLLKYKSDTFRSSLIRINAKKKSKLKLFIIQNDGDVQTIESIYAKLEEGAKVEVYQYQLGSKNLNTNFKADLIGDLSQLDINSIYFGHKSNELDLLYEINHYGKSSLSNIVVNGALKDGARKTFKSTLDFKKGSIQSKGSEEEFALLLTDDVRALSVPVLLAHEDDVEGNHAASSGKIDQDLVFFICSRGFTKEEAEGLILQSKFSSSIDEIDSPELKEELWSKILEIIRG